MLTEPPRRTFGPLLVTALVLVVVAAGFLTWSVVRLVSAGADVDRARQNLAAAQQRVAGRGDDDTIAIKTARDQAVAAGGKAVAIMNTLDYRTIDAGLDEWERVTTGSLHDEIVSGREQSRKAITDAKSVTKATVLAAAAQEVDERAGTATVLVSLKVTVAANGADPTDRYQRIKGTLARTGKEWKLDGIEQVAAGS
jgi:Mce-associated membrane protein